MALHGPVANMYRNAQYSTCANSTYYHEVSALM
jgi:hypothetical protein